MSKFSNVFNVGNFIRKNTKFKVSPSFVEEVKSTIEAFLEPLIGEANQLAKAEGMRTLQDKHMVRVNDYRLPDRNHLVTCNECGKSFVIASTDKHRKMSCPFCGKKKGIKIE